MIVGYTNGYFDMFHVGHLNLLQRASKLCDRLIVGVISDDECEKRKGIRPVIPHDQRIKIISGLYRIDCVVPVWDDDKFEEWKHYKFRKLFVGSDHYGSHIWDAWEEKLRGHCEIIYLPYTKEVSTTKIKGKIIEEANQAT